MRDPYTIVPLASGRVNVLDRAGQPVQKNVLPGDAEGFVRRRLARAEADQQRRRHYYQNADEAAMVPIPREALPQMIGKPIHLSWARNGARWILRRIEGDTLHLETPRTHCTRTAKAGDARYIRALEPREGGDA